MLDKVIIGAGLYGLYAALYCARKGQNVIVIEQEKEPFTRATYINQARVHMGYHYPRSISTAMKSAGYFRRFVEEFSDCIYSDFDQIYATSSHFSWTDAEEFMKFCRSAGIPCKEIPISNYFKDGVCDGAFLTREYTYDAFLLRDEMLSRLKECGGNVKLLFGRKLTRIVKKSDRYEVYARNLLQEGASPGEERYEAPFVMNATYASVNQVLQLLEGVEPLPFALKYELCEIILCRVGEALQKTGLTVMDGPFFSIMPFGKTGRHSLTSVTFTPHQTSYSQVPEFPCQKGTVCSGRDLGNCNSCAHKPESAWEYMSALARKYMREELEFTYEKSLYSMKPILKASEIDDSRPTVIKFVSQEPTFVSVLSGKINTIFDLDGILDC